MTAGGQVKGAGRPAAISEWVVVSSAAVKTFRLVTAVTKVVDGVLWNDDDEKKSVRVKG